MEMTLCLSDGEGVCVESSNLELYKGAESGGSRHSKIIWFEWADFRKWNVQQDVGGHCGACEDLCVEWKASCILCG